MNTETQHHYTRIPFFRQHNEYSLLSSANYHMKNGNYPQAIEFFEQFNRHATDLNASLSLARCYQYIDQYEVAIAYYKQILSWDNNRRTLVHLARAYEELAKREQSHHKKQVLLHEALNTYKQIENWDTDRDILLSLAPCYRALGWYEDALQAYSKIIPGNNIRQNQAIQRIMKELEDTLNMARVIANLTQQGWFYFNNMKYSDAAYIYGELYRLTNSYQVMLNQASCFILDYQYENALFIYEQIPHEIKDTNIFAHQAMVYEVLEKYQEAIYLFKHIYKHTEDTTALIAIDRCCKKQALSQPSVKSHTIFREELSPTDVQTQAARESLTCP